MRRACSGSAPSPASSSCRERHAMPSCHSIQRGSRSGLLFVCWTHSHANFAKRSGPQHTLWLLELSVPLCGCSDSGFCNAP